jgi:hypothetical protein
MGYALANRIRNERFEKSVSAAEKWLKGESPSEAKLAEAKEMFARLAAEYGRDKWTTESTKEKRLYWWGLKVYNGMLILTSSPYRTKFIWG